jgi:hypothetical protein
MGGSLKRYFFMKGEEAMRVFKEDKRLCYFLAVLFVVDMFLGGCAAKINYSYDLAADFSMGKNYTWESGKFTYTYNRDFLIEKKVCYYADQYLKNKGFTLTPDKPDFVISMNYETEYYNPYKIQILNLYVYRTLSKELIWQGTAEGTINVDAASSDLAKAVKKILMKFPPK